jgi:hypothetical protein
VRAGADVRVGEGVQGTDSYDATIETLKAIPHPISQQTQIMVEMCAYAGSGNVLKVQEMLRYCDEHVVDDEDDEKKDEKKDGEAKEGGEAQEEGEGEEKKEKEKEKKDDAFQAFAVLGIALVAMGEEVGSQMALRQFNHLVRAVCPCRYISLSQCAVRCTTASLSSGAPFHSRSALSRPQILSSRLWTRSRNTRTTTTSASP